MPRNPERRRVALRWFINRLAAVALLALTAPVTPASAQASGDVRLKIVKAGLLVGGGVGSGVLIYRGRTYPFRLSGVSLGITAGATVGRSRAGRRASARSPTLPAPTVPSVVVLRWSAA